MRRGALLLVAASIVAAACVGPARTDASYRRKASSTVATVRSAAETAQLTASSSTRHGLPATYLSVVFGEAEDDASAAGSTFGSIQPPSSRSDAVRTATLDAIDPAIDLLATLRILVRRGEVHRAEVAAGQLAAVVRQLDRFADRLDG